MSALERKTAVVTRAASGIGRAAAERFAAAEAYSVPADATALAARLGGTFVPTDVSDERAVGALMRHAAARRGRIDVVVNNAGITGEAPLAEADAAEFEQMIGGNMRSADRFAAAGLVSDRRQGNLWFIPARTDNVVAGGAPAVQRTLRSEILWVVAATV